MQDAEPVVRTHCERGAGRHRLLAVAVVERAGYLALAVEAHRALLDAAHRSIARSSSIRSCLVRCSGSATGGSVGAEAGVTVCVAIVCGCLPLRDRSRRDLRGATWFQSAGSGVSRGRPFGCERGYRPAVRLRDGRSLDRPRALALARCLDVAGVRRARRRRRCDRACAADQPAGTERARGDRRRACAQSDRGGRVGAGRGFAAAPRPAGSPGRDRAQLRGYLLRAVGDGRVCRRRVGETLDDRARLRGNARRDRPRRRLHRRPCAGRRSGRGPITPTRW